MPNLKPLFALLCLFAGSVLVRAADLASVNFDSVQTELRALYFSRPEQAAQKAAYEAAAQQEKAFQEAVQKAVLEGGKPMEVATKSAARGMGRFELERALKADLRRELFLVVESLGRRYDLIYDSSSSEAIVYAKATVEDITPLVRQELIRRLGVK